MKPIYQLSNVPKFDKVLAEVLYFHLKPGSSILDPTFGFGHSWRHYDKIQKGLLKNPFRIKYHDSLIGMAIRHLPKIYKNEFDGIFFDPPYIWGSINDAPNNRAEDYGKYNWDLVDIELIIKEANDHFPELLKPKGKIFFKYTDVFSRKDHRFFLTTPMWVSILDNFHPIDFYITRHPRGNGTAFQVKNRPCGVNNYTYLMVMELK